MCLDLPEPLFLERDPLSLVALFSLATTSPRKLPDKVRTRLLFGKRIYRMQFLRYNQTCQSTCVSAGGAGDVRKASDGVTFIATVISMRGLP